MDAGYGCNTALRAGIDALSLRYVAGITPHTTVWAWGTGPLPPKKWSGNGRPPKLIRRDEKHHPVSVKELALGLRNEPGVRSTGARAQAMCCPRALRGCVCEQRIATRGGYVGFWLVGQWHGTGSLGCENPHNTIRPDRRMSRAASSASACQPDVAWEAGDDLRRRINPVHKECQSRPLEVPAK
jgi:hypothetical protein